MALRWIAGLSAICVLFLLQNGVFAGRDAVVDATSQSRTPSRNVGGEGLAQDGGIPHDAQPAVTRSSGLSISNRSASGSAWPGGASADAEAGLVPVSDLQKPVFIRDDPADPARIQLVPTPIEAVLQAEASTSPEGMLDLPATFAGDLACGDCEGLRYRLTLWQDDVFYLHREWLGSDIVEDSIGRWSLDGNRDVVVLSAAQAPIEFKVVDPATLRPLDGARAQIESGLDEALTSEARVEPIDMRIPLRGMIAFGAEGGIVSECLTGRTFPLTPDGDYSTLEAAFLAAGVAPGSGLLATFEARLTDGPGSTREQASQVVAVERFTGVWPEETCARDRSNVSLTDTYWKIVRLGQTDIVAGEAMGEPHMVLRSGPALFEATVGCNTLGGAFEADDTRLVLGSLERTDKACPPLIGDWEQQFIDVLPRARAWRIDGQMLELLDGDGSPIALFQAVLLR